MNGFSLGIYMHLYFGNWVYFVILYSVKCIIDYSRFSCVFSLRDCYKLHEQFFIVISEVIVIQYNSLHWRKFVYLSVLIVLWNFSSLCWIFIMELSDYRYNFLSVIEIKSCWSNFFSFANLISVLNYLLHSLLMIITSNPGMVWNVYFTLHLGNSTCILTK